MKTMVSVLLVAVVAAGSLWVSTNAIQTHLQEASAQEKTLADLLVQQQMKEQLAAAAEKVAQEVETQNLVIDQAEVTLKDPDPIPEPEVEEVLAEVEEVPSQEDSVQEDVTQEDSAQEVETTPTYVEPLDLAEIDDVEGYLIANYFLNGYEYAAAETDPVLKARKELACAMEAYTIDTIDELMGLMDAMSALDLTQTQAIYDAMVAGKTDFQAAYGYLDGDETFGGIYTAVVKYFDQAIALAELSVGLLEQMKASTNALLGLSTLMKAVDAQLMPQVDAVLNAVFDMKELTNAVYLQGTDGVILTKDDARALVEEMEGLFLAW